MKRRVFEEPSGHCRIMVLNEKMRLPDESDDDFAARMFPIETAKQADLGGLSFADVEEADIPSDRSQRNKLRVKTRGGKKVLEVDPAV